MAQLAFKEGTYLYGTRLIPFTISKFVSERYYLRPDYSIEVGFTVASRLKLILLFGISLMSLWYIPPLNG